MKKVFGFLVVAGLFGAVACNSNKTEETTTTDSTTAVMETPAPVDSVAVTDSVAATPAAH